MTQAVKAAVIALPRFVGFINSVAYAKAAAFGTTLGYGKYTENPVMDFLLRATTAEPGFAEVQQDQALIERHRQRIAGKLLDQALEAGANSPQAFNTTLQRFEADKQRDLASVRLVFQQAQQINSQIEHSLTMTIRTLATVKAVSSIAIAVTPVGLAAGGASAALVASAGTVAFVYSVSKAVAKNVAEGSDAGVIAFETTKEVGKEGIQRGAETVSHTAEHSIGQHTNLIRDAEAKIETLSKRLARDLATKKRGQLERRMGRATQALQTSTKSLQAAKTVRVAAKGVPVIFAAMDVWEAIGDFQKEW
jgi:hypothetical protein